MFRWGCTLMAVRLCSVKIDQELVFSDQYNILKEIEYLWNLLDLYYQSGGHNYVKYIIREMAVEHPKIEEWMQRNYCVPNWTGTIEAVPPDEGEEHQVRKYKSNIRHNNQNQFLREHGTDIAREMGEVQEPISKAMELIYNDITGKTSKEKGASDIIDEPNEKLFRMYAVPITAELDRQVHVIETNYNGNLPVGKYLPLQLTELSDHSDSIKNVNAMLSNEFISNENASLHTPITHKYLGGKTYQKGPSPQSLREFRSYVCKVGDEDMPVASLEHYAAEIETKDHTFKVPPSQEWLNDIAQRFSYANMIPILLEFLKGVGICGSKNSTMGRMNPEDWTSVRYSKSDQESEEEAFFAAVMLIFSKLFEKRALSIIRQKPVQRPTAQETRLFVGRSMHALWPDRYKGFKLI